MTGRGSIRIVRPLPTLSQHSSNMSDQRRPSSSEKPSLDELGGRISKARHAAGLEKSAASEDAEREFGAGLGAAWRISIEIVVALVVCTAIGWALDYWFGTKPWLMLLFLFLGGAAGINNAVRTALRMDAQATEALQMKSGQRPAAAKPAESKTERGERRDG